MRTLGLLIFLGAACLPGARDGKAQSAATESTQSAAVANPSGMARTERCPAILVDVSAGSADERELVCSASEGAIELLGRCGIRLRRPLDVQILNDVRSPSHGAAIFGTFDSTHERALITQEATVSLLVRDTPFAALPLRDFYRSLIVHEVVHGIMHQNLKRPPTTHAAYEYSAYVLQVESLGPQVREWFLRTFEHAKAQAESALFIDAILFIDPYFFAARAYHHFKSAVDGCAHLHALLEGDVSFIVPSDM